MKSSSSLTNYCHVSFEQGTRHLAADWAAVGEDCGWTVVGPVRSGLTLCIWSRVELQFKSTSFKEGSVFFSWI